MKEKFQIARTKTGKPTVCEHGGGMTNTGSATVIAGKDGERLAPLFVPKGYCNGTHAEFIARVGMYIVEASRSRNGESATAWKIKAIGKPGKKDDLIAERVAVYENGDGNFPEFLEAAKDAALEKSRCYHCRKPHYIARG